MLDFKSKIEKKLGNNKDLYSFHSLGRIKSGSEVFEIVLDPSQVSYGEGTYVSGNYVDLYCVFSEHTVKFETFDLALHIQKLPSNFEGQLNWETDINGLNKMIKRIIKDMKTLLKLINK